MNIVWFAFIVGFVSHLIMDTLTTEGVPWLFPLPFHIGFPPFREFRVVTGGLVEKVIITALLLFINGYLFYNFYPIYLHFLKTLIK
jgi:inner membrane protein